MNFNKLFTLAKEKGLEDIQVLYEETNSTDITVYNGELDNVNVSRVSSLSAKALYKGRMAYYSTEEVSAKAFPKIVEELLNSAKILNSKDEEFIYEGDPKYKKLPFLFNKSLNEHSMDEKIALVLKACNLLKAKANVVQSQAGYEEAETTMIMINSKGLKVKNHRNYAELYAMPIVSKDNDVRNEFAFYLSNNFEDFDAEKIANEAYERTVSMIGAKPVKSGKYNVVFSERTTASILGCFTSMFSSEAVQKGLSVLKGKVGERIGSSKVTLVDDPFLKMSMQSTSCDSEGVATQYKEIVKNGVLTNYFYNLKTAKKDGVKSTGNGFGGGARPVNFHFKTGRKTKDEVIALAKDGLYITSLAGLHSGANSINGQFSVQAAGYVIRDGKIAEPVALITVSDSFLNLLSNVKEVSNELANAFDSPAILVKGIAVAGL